MHTGTPLQQRQFNLPHTASKTNSHLHHHAPGTGVNSIKKPGLATGANPSSQTTSSAASSSNSNNASFFQPIRHEQIRSALLHFTVNLVGILFLISLYLNYLMLQPYMRPLLWAAVLSVPLHSLKTKLVGRLESAWSGTAGREGFVLRILKGALKSFFGRAIYEVVADIADRYKTWVKSLAGEKRMETPPSSPLLSPNRVASTPSLMLSQSTSMENLQLRAAGLENTNSPVPSPFLKKMNPTSKLAGGGSNSVSHSSTANLLLSAKSNAKHLPTSLLGKSALPKSSLGPQDSTAPSSTSKPTQSNGYYQTPGGSTMNVNPNESSLVNTPLPYKRSRLHPAYETPTLGTPTLQPPRSTSTHFHITPNSAPAGTRTKLAPRSFSMGANLEYPYGFRPSSPLIMYPAYFSREELEQAVEEIINQPSSAYFAALGRCSVIYLVYLLVKDLSVLSGSVLVGSVLLLGGGHVGWHCLLGVWRRKREKKLLEEMEGKRNGKKVLKKGRKSRGVSEEAKETDMLLESTEVFSEGEDGGVEGASQDEDEDEATNDEDSETPSVVENGSQEEDEDADEVEEGEADDEDKDESDKQKSKDDDASEENPFVTDTNPEQLAGTTTTSTDSSPEKAETFRNMLHGHAPSVFSQSTHHSRQFLSRFQGVWSPWAFIQWIWLLITGLASTLINLGFKFATTRIERTLQDRQVLNNYVAIFLIIATVSGLTLLAAFLAVKVSQEANMLVDTISERVLGNDALREKMKGVVAEFQKSAIHYLDAKLIEIYPGMNITVTDIYGKLQETFVFMSFAGGNATASSYYGIWSGADGDVDVDVDVDVDSVNVSDALNIGSMIVSASMDGSVAGTVVAKEIGSNAPDLSVVPSSFSSLPSSSSTSSMNAVPTQATTTSSQPNTVNTNKPRHRYLYNSSTLFSLLFLNNNSTVSLWNTSMIYDAVLEARSLFRRGVSWWSGRTRNGTSSSTSSSASSRLNKKRLSTNGTVQMNDYDDSEDEEGNGANGVNATSWSSLGTSFVSSSLNMFIMVFVNVFQVLYYAFDLSFQWALFFITLYYLLIPEQSIIHYTSRPILLLDTKQKVKSSIERNIKSVLLVTIKLAVFHMGLTWLTFNAFGVEFVYSAVVVSAIISVIPLVSHYWLAVPAVLGLWANQDVAKAVLFGFVHFFVVWVVDPKIYAEIQDANPFFSALFTILGWYQFGWEGLLYGPVIGCIPAIASDLFEEVFKSRDNVK